MSNPEVDSLWHTVSGDNSYWKNNHWKERKTTTKAKSDSYRGVRVRKAELIGYVLGNAKALSSWWHCLEHCALKLCTVLFLWWVICCEYVTAAPCP